jgi:hypothetical protein
MPSVSSSLKLEPAGTNQLTDEIIAAAATILRLSMARRIGASY